MSYLLLKGAFSTAAVAAVWSVVVFAQDPVKADPAHYKLVFENATVRVLAISFPPSVTGKMHQHPDSIVIPMANARVRFATPDGKTEDREMANESASYMPAGTHQPTNIGTEAIHGFVVEFKAPVPGNAILPISRPGRPLTVLAEGPYATARRWTASATFTESAGTKVNWDQVVIALGEAQLSLSFEGKVVRTKWARGDVQFIGRDVAHQATNIGGTPVDMVIVAIR